MTISSNVHEQFAAYFPSATLRPYIYLLSKKMSEGHICIDLNALDEAELDALFTFPKVDIALDKLVSDGRLTRPFVLANNRLYTHRYYQYETQVLESIFSFLQKEEDALEDRIHRLQQLKEPLQELFPHKPGQQTDWQLIAALNAFINQFTIITGGPGTGKTTTVAKILALLLIDNPTLKVALAAPTGKAAARMGESLMQAASHAGLAPSLIEAFSNIVPGTIHRLLGYQPHSIYFKHNAENPLHDDVIIIDESSMIDVALFAKLLSAIPPGTRVILLGDKDQLASVEAGSLFGDLCQALPQINTFSRNRLDRINSLINPSQQIPESALAKSPHPLADHIIGLQISHRFSDEEGIGKFSKAIIRNDQPSIHHFIKNEDQRIFIDTQYSEEVFQACIDGYRSYIQEPDILAALQKLNALKVLCVIREGEQGLYAMNKKIESYLMRKNLIRLTGEYYENRPVLITGNDYELGLFNGDTGIVRKDDQGEFYVWIERNGEAQKYSPYRILAAETAFAMTIHKSQGSEFEKVCIVLPDTEHLPLLSAELLYTAVTRAKKQVVIQGRESALFVAASTSVQRGSGIRQRISPPVKK